MMANSDRLVLSDWLWRGAGYYAFWILLIGVKPVDLLVGLGAAAAATWVSLALLPPGGRRLRLAGLPRYGVHFIWQSVVAGVGVARLAFAPLTSLRAGLTSYSTQYPPGAARNAFASLTSLLPATLSLGDEPQGLRYHFLDTGQPVVEQLAAEEVSLSRVLPREPWR